MPTKKLKILIVGAGPTGLTAALELTRRGIMPDIIDKKDSPSPLSRAVGILPSSMKIFEQSGVADQIRAQAIEASELRLHQGHILKTSLPINILPDPNMRILALPQDKTEHILRQKFESLGGNITYGTHLDDLTQDTSSVQVIMNGKKKKYDYVIGADGTRSQTRNSLGLNFIGYELDEKWSIADFETTQDYGAHSFNIFFLPKGKAVLLIPLSHHKSKYRYRAVSSSPDALKALPIDIKSPTIKRTGKFTIKVAQVEEYQKGRVFLAGDAAHCHSPVGGRGMNLGISDAAYLAQLFAEGGLEKYHPTRHAEGQRVIETTEAARRFIMSDSCWKRPFFIWTVRLAGILPPLHKIFLKNMLTN